MGGSNLKLEGFTVEIKDDKPLVKIKGYVASDNEVSPRIKLIRQGEVIKVFETGNIFDIVYEDGSRAKGEKTYYRLEITLPGGC